MKFKKKNTVQLLIVAISFSLPAAAHADFGVSVGAGNAEEYKGLDDEARILLGLEYRGDKFNMGKGGISYDFTDSNKYAVEALISSKNSGYEDKDSKTLKGMDDRDPSIDIGGRVIVDTGLGPAVIELTKDVNASKGYEAGIKLGGIAPHAPHWTGEREVKFAAAAGLRYQSKKVVDYYYGVKNSEVTASRKAYKGKSAITPYIGVEAQANLTKHISINGDIGVTRRANSIRNSPLIDDDKYQAVANIGFTYWF